MTWEIEFTDQFGDWFQDISDADRDTVVAAVNALGRGGPGLGRPLVDTIHSSRHANMKELRPQASSIRVFFAFDPRRMAILLIGGNKRHRWQAFYTKMIPVADDLYDEHLRTLREEGLLP